MSSAGLGADANFFCRVFFDGPGSAGREVFRERAITENTFLHKTGFKRFGAYGITIPFETKERIFVELGLVGAGRVAFHDFHLINVSAIEDAYEGKKTIAESDFLLLPESERRGLTARPDSLFSLRGAWFLLTAYLHLCDWANPLTGWAGFCFLLLSGTFALILIMRRQWVDNERFMLPMTQVPRALIGVGESDEHVAPVIWKSRIMWFALAATVTWCVLRAWAHYNASIPDLSITVNLNSYISDPRFGEMFQNIPFTITAFALGLALFMDLHILLSLFVGFWIFRSEFWVGEATGLVAQPGFPFDREQVSIAFLSYALLILVFARRHLAQVLREAWQGGNRSGEAVSYRWAVIILISCLAGSVLWGRWVGIPPRGALILFLILLAFGFVAARLRAECGAPGPLYYPAKFLVIVPFIGGIGMVGPEGGVFFITFTYVMGSLIFFIIPGIQLELVQVGREMEIPRSHIVGTALLGFFGGVIIGGVVYLATCYSRGADNFENLASYDPAIEIYGEFTGWHTAATARYFETGSQVDWSVFGAASGKTAIFAAAGTVATTVLRHFFAGFWFHPVGFILGASGMMKAVWGSVLAAWFIRFMTLRLGGAAAVRRFLYPAAIGLVVGSALANAIFTLVNFWIFLHHPGLRTIPLIY